jgi:hypothetical protein
MFASFWRHSTPITVTLGLLVGACSPCLGEVIYKLRGASIPYSPYRDALVSLSIQDGTVVGQLRPLLGDRTPPVAITGSSEGDSILRLRLDYPSGPERFVFRRQADTNGSDRIVFRSGSQSMFRFKGSAFSPAALTFTEYECGDQLRLIVAEFVPTETEGRLNEYLSRETELADLNVKNKTGRVQSLKDALKTQRPVGRISFYTPFGTEAYVGKALRESGIFSTVDFDSGGCGVNERTPVTVARDRLYEGTNLSEDLLQKFIDAQLASFAGGKVGGSSWEFRLGEKTISRLNLPPYRPSYRVKVYAASEVTRKAPGWWDAFYVSFEPGDLLATKGNETALLITVERLQSSKRSSGRTDPPDDTYFSSYLTFQEEATVTTAIRSFFANASSGN